MPIIAAFFIILVTLGYAAHWIYEYVAMQFGAFWGTSAVICSAAIIIGVIFYYMKRHQRLHGRKINKERILRNAVDRGYIELEPEHKRGSIHLESNSFFFIFADIQHIQQHTYSLHLQLRDVPQPLALCFATPSTANLWHKRLRLAAEQRL